MRVNVEPVATTMPKALAADASPVRSVPIRLPATTVLAEPFTTSMPVPEFEPIWLRSSARPPPMRAPVAPLTRTPTLLPVNRLPATTDVLCTTMPVVNPLIARPATVELPVPGASTRPSAAGINTPESCTRMSALMPTVSVLTSDSGCVYPSMVTGAVMTGNGVVGTMVCGPVPSRLNAMSSAVPPALLSMIAARRVQVRPVVRHWPSPGSTSGSSPVLSTVNDSALTVGTTAGASTTMPLRPSVRASAVTPRRRTLPVVPIDPCSVAMALPHSPSMHGQGTIK